MSPFSYHEKGGKTMDNNHNQANNNNFGYINYPENFIYKQEEIPKRTQYDSQYWDNYFFPDDNEEFRFLNKET
jgi:hypothetical protein